MSAKQQSSSASDALLELVEFLEEHRAFCKRNGERPIIDAARLSRARKALGIRGKQSSEGNAGGEA